MKIVKMTYSHNPWRLIDSKGNEVWIPAGYDHPLMERNTISHPVAGNTKKECMENVLALLGVLFEKLKVEKENENPV